MEQCLGGAFLSHPFAGTLRWRDVKGFLEAAELSGRGSSSVQVTAPKTGNKSSRALLVFIQNTWPEKTPKEHSDLG